MDSDANQLVVQQEISVVLYSTAPGRAYCIVYRCYRRNNGLSNYKDPKYQRSDRHLLFLFVDEEGGRDVLIIGLAVITTDLA